MSTKPAASTKNLPDPNPSAREKLIVAAARHFADFGMEGASQRAIQREVGVNVSTAHYYFGSKADLYKAVIETALTRVQAERTAAIDHLALDTSMPRHARARTILDAYISPFLRESASEVGYSYARIVARLQVTRSDIASNAITTYVEPLRNRYIDALSLVYPGSSRQRIAEVLRLIIGLASTAPLQVERDSLTAEVLNRVRDDVLVIAVGAFEALCG